jgi:hypothetical protein
VATTIHATPAAGSRSSADPRSLCSQQRAHDRHEPTLSLCVCHTRLRAREQEGTGCHGGERQHPQGAERA